MSLLEDFKSLREQVHELSEQTERNKKTTAVLHEQINGERGLSNAIKDLSAEVKGLRKAAYWLAALIVTSSIGFAFSVLTVFGGP